MKVHMELDDQFIATVLVKVLQKYIRDKLQSPRALHFEDTYNDIRAIDAANVLLEEFGGTSERVKLPWEEPDEDRKWWDEHEATT